MRRALDMRISSDFRLTRTAAVRMAAVVALCTLALTGCGKKEAPENDDDPKISGQTISYPASVKTEDHGEGSKKKPGCGGSGCCCH